MSDTEQTILSALQLYGESLTAALFAAFFSAWRNKSLPGWGQASQAGDCGVPPSTCRHI